MVYVHPFLSKQSLALKIVSIKMSERYEVEIEDSQNFVKVYLCIPLLYHMCEDIPEY